MVRIRDASELSAILERIDGSGYKAYRDCEGAWALDRFTLRLDHAQGDPFATPSRVRVTVEPAVAALPPWCVGTEARRLGVAALLARRFVAEARGRSRRRGTGRSGEIRMEDPGQIVVAQTAVMVSPSGAIEARFGVGLPAKGRRVAGAEARAMLLEDVPAIVERALVADAYDGTDLERAAAVNEDAEALRDALRARALVAFVADGARLPRRSGIDDRPLEHDHVVAFRSPESMRVHVDLPNAGTVGGMGIREGVTLVVGGGFHGKSTLLRAIQDGVYNHCPGDGRERVATVAEAVKVRAEDGRSVAAVDISPFIGALPLERTTRAFSTTNASGSTSQASAIAEALEAGARVLLLDEDTSATNFMIRDRRMQALVPKRVEPITPFVDRVRELYDGHGVSTIVVLGGSGDYLDVADCVIRMSEYLPENVTDAAREVATALPTGRSNEADGTLRAHAPRSIDPTSLDAGRGRKRRNVKVPDDHTLVLGTETIDLAAVEQLIVPAQTRALGHALAWVSEEVGEKVIGVGDLLDAVEGVLARDGLDAITEWPTGELALFRRFELAAALGRLRTLRASAHRP